MSHAKWILRSGIYTSVLLIFYILGGCGEQPQESPEEKAVVKKSTAAAESLAQSSPTSFIVSDDVPWVDLNNSKGFNWSAAAKKMPEVVERIDKILRNRRVLLEEGFGLGNLAQGPGSIYPYHNHASPELYHIISGQGEWSVDGVTYRVHPGMSIYHKPYAKHRMYTLGDEPIRTVWAQWVPEGERDKIGTGYQMSGPIPEFPASAVLDRNLKFFPDEEAGQAVTGVLLSPVRTPDPESFIGAMAQASMQAITKENSVAGEDHSAAPFQAAADKPWLDLTTTDDKIWGEMRQVIPEQIDELNKIMLVKTTFASKDLYAGHFVFASGASYPAHSRAAPMVYNVVAGEAEWTVDGETEKVRAGSVISIGESVEQRLKVTSAEPLRAVWFQRAPRGDMSYWARDYFFIEPLPPQPETATLPRDIRMFE